MVINKFLHYVSFDTQSDPNSETVPSTTKQLLLGAELVKELKEMGIENAHMDDNGYIYASIEGNNKDAKTVGFIAHMDTAGEYSGKDVHPTIIENYDGKDIKLKNGLVTKVDDFKFLSEQQGKTLVVTDGTTLLGADDKAGIAAIMQLAEELVNGDRNHGDVKIGFTPDEEIGRGADHFDVKKFGADFAYTIDGSQVGGVDYENFNAASLDVSIKGVSIHPGDAKDRMINPLNVAHEFHAMLETTMRPEHTENYEGFYHLLDMSGNSDHASMEYIIRNHDDEIFKQQKETVKMAADFINHKYNQEVITVTLEDSYYNMARELADKMYIIDIAKEAHVKCGIEPYSEPIRGGTDGSRLTFMGLPCPNLGNGGYNFHGPHELLVVEQLQLAVAVMNEIVKSVGQ